MTPSRTTRRVSDSRADFEAATGEAYALHGRVALETRGEYIARIVRQADERGEPVEHRQEYGVEYGAGGSDPFVCRHAPPHGRKASPGTMICEACGMFSTLDVATGTWGAWKIDGLAPAIRRAVLDDETCAACRCLDGIECTTENLPPVDCDYEADTEDPRSCRCIASRGTPDRVTARARPGAC